MKNKIIISYALVISSLAFSQIGINTSNPVSTLEIAAKNATGTTTNVDGLLVPRVDRQRAQSMTATPVSTLIYVNSIATGTAAGTATNIDETGYYYFDGTVWTKLKTPTGGLSTNIYNADGTLSGNRMVTQGTNTLTFNSTTVNGFSVNGNTFSVDGLNNRIGIGTASPSGRIHLYNPTTGTDEGNDYVMDDESPSSLTQAIVLRRSNAGANLAQNNLIGGVVFNPKINGSFGYAGAGITGIYRGDGTNALTALSLRINNSQEAARIDENGNVGIGTSTPQRKLHVNGALQVTNELNVGGNDTTAGSAGTAGQVLFSNGNGVAPSWQSLNSLKSVLFGTMSTSNITITNSSTLIGHSLTLTPGRWIIYVGELINSNAAADSDNNRWTRLTLSNSNSSISNTGFTYLGSSLVSGWLSPSVTPSGAFSMLNGVIPINVTGASVTVYLWCLNSSTVGTPPASNFGGNSENYFFAVPAN